MLGSEHEHHVCREKEGLSRRCETGNLVGLGSCCCRVSCHQTSPRRRRTSDTILLDDRGLLRARTLRNNTMRRRLTHCGDRVCARQLPLSRLGRFGRLHQVLKRRVARSNGSQRGRNRTRLVRHVSCHDKDASCTNPRLCAPKTRASLDLQPTQSPSAANGKT